jgi:hypothetical protein
MRFRVLSSSALLVAAVLCAPAAVTGQPLPAGPVSRISPPAQDTFPGTSLDQQVSATAFSGGFAVGWQRFDRWSDPDSSMPFFVSTATDVGLVDPAGKPGTMLNLATGDLLDQTDPGAPTLAAAADGGLVAAWPAGRDDGIDVWFQILNADGTARTQAEFLGSQPPGPSTLFGPFLASHPKAGFVLAWSDDFEAAGVEMKVRGYGPSGSPAAPVRVLPPVTAGWQPYAAAVVIDPTGHFFLTWEERSPDGTQLLSWGRRFALDGTPAGFPRRLPTARLVARRDGGFVLIAPAPAGVDLSRYTRTGNPTGLTVAVPLTAGDQVVASAADSRGNLALLLRSGNRFLLLLVNRDLVAQGAPVEIGTTWSDGLASGPLGALAFGADDRLFAAWAGPPAITTPTVAQRPVWSRLFQPRKDADPCVYRENRFLCDTAGDGGVAEVSVAFGGGQPLVGDWDGDGRADFCLVRAGRTLCDTAHDGGTAEMRSPHFGFETDAVLLGDVDGDGKADPCRFGAHKFSCDLARNGGKAELTIAFGMLGDKPVLGDVDGDGRADPCVMRAGRLLCDTAHDGGLGEVRMNLRTAFGDAAVDGTPVLGDLNGDGRADPCVVWGGTFLCGIYGPQGGLPQRVFARFFGGAPVEVPLLGDIDDF